MAKERRKANGLKTSVFSVDMHRKCNGCIKKINDGMKRISLSEEGVEWADLMVEKAEVKVLTTDPEKLCCLLREVKIRTESTVSEGGTPNISGNQRPTSWPGSFMAHFLWRAQVE